MKYLTMFSLIATASIAMGYTDLQRKWAVEDLLRNQRDIQNRQDEILRNQRNAEWQRDVLLSQNEELLRKQQELLKKQEELKSQQAQAAKDSAERDRQMLMRQNAMLSGGALPMFSAEVGYIKNREVVLKKRGARFRIPGNKPNAFNGWSKGDMVDVYDNSANDDYCKYSLVNATRGGSTVAVGPMTNIFR